GPHPLPQGSRCGPFFVSGLIAVRREPAPGTARSLGMGFLDRLLGRSRDERPAIPGMTGGGTPRGYQSPTQAHQPGMYQQEPTAARTAPPSGPDSSGPGTSGPAPDRHPDDVAIDRYRYLLRTAPPDAVEQAHAEAFSQLTPEQRQRVLPEAGATVPESERATS